MENRTGSGRGSKARFAYGSARPVAPRVTDVGVELGYLTHAQADAASMRHDELLSMGIQISLAQVLIERRFLAPGQVRALLNEVEYRRAHQLAGLPKPAATQINRRCGPFHLLEVLSENGRCRVFLARDVSMGRLVVLKVLPSQIASDPQWLVRFRREVSLAGRLAHPNIVTAYGTGEIEGCPYLALEYVRGQSLQERLDREGNLPEKSAWLMAREVAKGLNCAARQGVLHRDIKPANILCGVSGSIKICDLGLSKSMSDSSLLTMAGMTVGTPFYMSPEQVHASAEIDVRSDIYSLGCTVFHMLTGSVPFLGHGVSGVMRAHVQAPRPDPRSLLPEISEASAILLARMMAVRPGDRPFDAEALVAEIDAILPSLPEPEEMERPLPVVVPTEAPFNNALARMRRSAQTLFAPSRWERAREWVMRLIC